MDRKGNKIYLTPSEWKLANFPAPPGCDLQSLREDSHVPIPIRTAPDDIMQAQNEIYRQFDRLQTTGASVAELMQIDSLAVRLARTAGLDPETLQPLPAHSDTVIN